MKEKGIFFTKEQREMLDEISKLENNPLYALRKDLKHSEMPERVFVDERKKLTVLDRMEIVIEIQNKYSLLKKYKGIFDEQLFCAMEDYLRSCTDTGRRFEGL
jgi:hypothetical protein